MSTNMLQENGVKVKPRLVGNDKFLVEGVSTLDEFIAAIPKESPLGVALSGGGTVEIHGVKFVVPNLPMNRLTVEPVEGDRNQKGVVGLMARLPEFLAYLQLRFERPNWMPAENVMRTTYADFLMNDITRFIEENVMIVRLRGLQAHASTDLRLEWDEVGVSPRTAKALLTWLGTDSEVRRTPDGLICLAMRYPIMPGMDKVGEVKGCRKVVLRILPELPGTMVAMHPVALQLLHQGDTDGDVIFLAFPWRTRYVNPRQVGGYPRIEMLDGRNPMAELFANHKMTTREDAVHQVMGARIKKMTGLLVYTGYCLSRAYEVALKDRKKAIAEVTTVFEVLVETVMDAKKTLVSMEPLYQLADGLKGFANGDELDATIFHPFLPDDELKETIDRIGKTVESMKKVRASVMGVLVASGRKRKNGVLRVVTTLLESGIEPKDVLATILADVELKKPVAMKVQEDDESRPQEGEKPVFAIDEERAKDEKGVDQAFLAITCNGVPVFERVRLEKTKDGRKVVVAFINPVWLVGSTFRWRVEVEIPFAQPVGDNGHFHVWMAGRGKRFFRPRLALVDGTVVKQGVMRLLQEALLDGISVLPNRKIRSANSGKLVESVLQQAITHAVNSLPISSPTADRVYRGEWDTVIPEELSIVEGWKVMETLLKHAAGLLGEEGEENEETFNVQATRKGKPGTVITKVGDHGVPDYLLRMDPFARYLPSKRIVETREFAMSLPFADPKPLPLTTGGYPLEEEEKTHLTPLTVAVFDCNLNVFEHEGVVLHHDTMLACPSIKKKTALAEIRMSCANTKSLEMVRERLAQQNITNFEVMEHPTDLGDGLEGISYEVIVHGPIEDTGKMRAYGKLKAVPVLMPHQLFAVNKKGERREIDGVFSRKTFVDGGCLDAALYMAVSKEWAGEVDPAWEARLEDIPDGVETIVAVYDDGTEEELGEAFVGTLPFFRPQQTGISLFHLRSGSMGVRVPHFALPLVDLDQSRLVLKSAHEEVGRFIQCWRETLEEGGNEVIHNEEETLNQLFPVGV